MSRFLGGEGAAFYKQRYRDRASLVAQWWRICLPMQETDIGDTGSIPGSGRSPGGGNGNLLQYSCLGSPMDRGALWATVHGVTKSQKRLSMHVACGNQGVLGAWWFFIAVTIRLLNLNVSTPYVHFLFSPPWSRFTVMLLSVVKGLFLKHLHSLISHISELVGVSIWLSITSWVTPLLQREEGLPYTVVTSVCNPEKSWCCWLK